MAVRGVIVFARAPFMRPIFLIPAVFLLLLAWSGCSSAPTTTASRPREHATVTKRDGTVVTGAIVSNSAAGITLEGPNGVAQTIPGDQIRTIEYEDHSAAHGGDPGDD